MTGETPEAANPAGTTRDLVDAAEAATAGSLAVAGSAMHLLFAEMRALAQMMPGAHPAREPTPEEGGDENVPV